MRKLILASGSALTISGATIGGGAAFSSARKNRLRYTPPAFLAAGAFANSSSSFQRFASALRNSSVSTRCNSPVIQRSAWKYADRAYRYVLRPHGAGFSNTERGRAVAAFDQKPRCVVLPKIDAM